MSKDHTTIIAYSIMALGMIINTLLSYYLKRDVNILKKWRLKRESKVIPVFMVDDNGDDLFIAEDRVLIKMGVRYKLYSDSVKCVEELPYEPIVIILDHYMPKMSGMDMVHKVLEKNPKSKLISYTGLNDKQITADYADKARIRTVYKDNPDWEIRLENAINQSFSDILNGI